MRIGLLYPTRDAGEDDYTELTGRLDPPVSVEVAYVQWGAGVDRLDSLDTLGKLAAVRELGEPARLRTAAESLRPFAPDVVTWACSSCSFLWGRTGARRQAEDVGAHLGVPASSTSLAFLAAAAALGLRRIALASVYSGVVTDAFVEFLAADGVATVHRTDLDAGSDRELAGWGPERLVEMARTADHPDADAVLIPETALHTAGLLPELERAVGKPVLTATQVTVWDALRRAGAAAAHPGLGTLFART